MGKTFMRKAVTAAAVSLAAVTAFSASGCTKLYGNDRSYVSYKEAAEDGNGFYYLMDSNVYFAEYLCQSKETGKFSILKKELAEGERAGATPDSDDTDAEANTPPDSDDDADADAGTTPDTDETDTDAGGEDDWRDDYWTSEKNGVLKYFGYPAAPVVLSGGSFPRNTTDLAPECEGLYDNLVERYYGKRGLKTYYAHDCGDGTVYGFCNVFNREIGYLSGGGQCGVEEIDFSVYFSYDIETGEFCEKAVYEGCNIVAYSENSVVYYRNKNYYCNVGGEEIYLCEDMAFDSGISSCSHACFWFNSEYAVLRFYKRYVNSQKDYVATVVCDFSGNVLLNVKD